MATKTVGELIDALQKFDRSLPVAVYVEVGEDMDDFHEVRLEKNDGSKLSYCKGDHFFSYTDDKEYNEVVVIG